MSKEKGIKGGELFKPAGDLMAYTVDENETSLDGYAPPSQDKGLALTILNVCIGHVLRFFSISLLDQALDHKLGKAPERTKEFRAALRSAKSRGHATGFDEGVAEGRLREREYWRERGYVL